MKRVRKSRQTTEADLDITAFMNLMIVLVPVLLLGMVFSQITVLDLKLPDQAIGGAADSEKAKQLELIIRQDEMLVNYPQGILLKRIPKIEVVAEEELDDSTATVDTPVAPSMDHDFKMLSLVLQEVKRQLREKAIDKKSIVVLSEPNTTYQTIVSTMDSVRSYKAVVAASVVDAELFPEVSFGDAPVSATAGGGQ